MLSCLKIQPGLAVLFSPTNSCSLFSARLFFLKESFAWVNKKNQIYYRFHKCFHDPSKAASACGKHDCIREDCYHCCIALSLTTAELLFSREACVNLGVYAVHILTVETILLPTHSEAPRGLLIDPCRVSFCLFLYSVY